MEKYKLDSYYIIHHFSSHKKIKKRLLKLIEIQSCENLKESSEYNDNITKLDWFSSKDFSRPWVELLKKPLSKCLDEICAECGYNSLFFYDIWFQQYIKQSTHGWHFHGHNMTGVYYLELPDEAPRTQLINPYNQKELITPEISEGDILLFPSFTIHRAPLITSNVRKTIISWNCEFRGLNQKLLNVLREYGK